MQSTKPRQTFLLLDRDGVINIERRDYVLSWEQFEFKSDFIENVRILNKLFERIVVLTNQSCVGRGLITKSTLDDIHNKMLFKIAEAKGRIDKVYYSVGFDMTDCERKPNIGLLEKLKADYPEFDPRHAIMVGNRDTDMQFAKNANILGIHYTNNETEEVLPKNLASWQILNWGEFEHLIQKIRQSNP